jgi:mono/diheme cytochrome c family protein
MSGSSLRRAALVVVALAACDDAGSALPAVDAGSSSSSSLVDPAVLERGEYLVRGVAGCGECHTPRDAQGNLDQSQWLAGVPYRFDLVPDDDTTGGISAQNLTPFGLSTWSDAAIKAAFLDGVDETGAPLFPLMPYYAYHNMTDADATAIVTYLRAVPSIASVIPDRQPLPVPLDGPAPSIPESAIPDTTLKPSDPSYASAERGRYLAGEIGFCLDCHTPWRLGITPPLDLTRVFAGNRAFSAKEWVVPAPAPAVVYSYNVTPDPSGIGAWPPDWVVLAIQTGSTPGSPLLCRPMPSGPTGGLGGMLAQDAMDIGVYLTTIPPLPGGDDVPQCPVGDDE